MLAEGPGAGMLDRILGGGVRDKHGKYGKRKCRRKRKYMGRKGRGMWGSIQGWYTRMNFFNVPSQ